MSTIAATEGKLELRYEAASGRRHYLCGSEVRCGAQLEVYRGNGQWSPVRYEWSFVKGELPTLHFGLEYVERAQDYHVFRWPQVDARPKGTALYALADQLAKSEKGRAAMAHVIEWLDDGGGLGLDQQNQEAILALLDAAWHGFAGTARDAMRSHL